MARVISLKEALGSTMEETTLQTVLNVLAQEYLFVEQDDYRIEVHGSDYDAVIRSIAEIKRDINLNSPQ